MVIIDEAAYINKQLYDETIRALTNMKDCGLIAISTPLGPDNFVSMLIDMKDENGDPFYNVMHMMAICDKCKQLPTLSEQSACPHTWLPSWKSHDKQKRNAQVGRVTGSVATTAQEDCGIIVPGMNGVIFDQKQLTKAFDIKDSNRVFDSHSYQPARIYVAIDPNADGKGGASNTAVWSCFWAPPAKPRTKTIDYGNGNSGTVKEFVMREPRLVLLGMDLTSETSSGSKDRLVLNHIKKIRNIPMYSKTVIILIPERGTGSFVTRCQEVAESCGNTVVVLREDGGSLPGVQKSDTATAGYVETWKKLMNHDQIRWHDRFFTLSSPYAEERRNSSFTKGSDVEILLANARLEMTRIKYEKRKITGKGKNMEFQDDSAIGLMMAAYWSRAVEDANADCYAWFRNLEWRDSVPTDRSGRPMGPVTKSLNMKKYSNLKTQERSPVLRKSHNTKTNNTINNNNNGARRYHNFGRGGRTQEMTAMPA